MSRCARFESRPAHDANRIAQFVTLSYLQFPNEDVLNAVGCRNTQMRANERKRAQTQVRKRAKKERTRAQKSASAQKSQTTRFKTTRFGNSQSEERRSSKTLTSIRIVLGLAIRIVANRERQFETSKTATGSRCFVSDSGDFKALQSELTSLRYQFGVIPPCSSTYCETTTLFGKQGGRNPCELKMGGANSIRAIQNYLVIDIRIIGNLAKRLREFKRWASKTTCMPI